jgi:hypothetical protein
VVARAPHAINPATRRRATAESIRVVRKRSRNHHKNFAVANRFAVNSGIPEFLLMFI